MDFYQACFTRVGGQGEGDGWQLVNCSPDLSEKSLSFFSKAQNSNISRPVFDPEDQQTKTVAEFISDNNYVFYTKIKYDVGTDTLGRSISFAHSYAFKINDFIHNPQDVLFLNDSNFRFSIDETKIIPSTLEMKDIPALKECVESSGLTKNTYKTLMRCVCYILDGKSRDTLHIICDCDLDTVQKLLFCIVRALPFEYRKRLSASTKLSRDSAYKTIVFDRKYNAGGEYFVNVSSGDNNVLSDILVKKMSRYGFIDVIPDGYEDVSSDKFFEDLDAELRKFVGGQPITLELYRVAYELMMATSTNSDSDAPEEYLKRLNNLLNVPLVHPYIDQQIQYALSDIMDHGIKMPKLLEDKVNKRLGVTRNADLKSCGKQFTVDKLLSMTPNDAAQMLNKDFIDHSSEDYKDIESLLKNTEKGREILDCAFVLNSETITPDEEHIVRFYCDTMSVKDRVLVAEALQKLMKRYIDRITVEKKNPNTIMEMCYRLMNEIGISDQQTRLDLNQYIKQKYWDNYDICDFEFENSYIISYIPDTIILPDHKNYEIINELLSIIEIFRQCDCAKLSTLLEKYFASTKSPLSFEKQKIIEEKLLKHLIRYKAQVSQALVIDNWLCLLHGFTQLEMNPVSILIDYSIGPFIHSFSISCENSRLLSEEKYWNWFMDKLRSCDPHSKEDEQIVNEAIKTMNRKKKGGNKPANMGFAPQSGRINNTVYTPFVPDNNAGPGQFVPDNNAMPGSFVQNNYGVPAPFVPNNNMAPSPFVQNNNVAPGPFIPNNNVAPSPFVQNNNVAPGPFIPNNNVAPSPFVQNNNAVPGPFVPNNNVAPSPFVPNTNAVPGPFVQQNDNEVSGAFVPNYDWATLPNTPTVPDSEKIDEDKDET